MMNRLRLLTAGESHGPELTVILEGMPAGLRLDADTVARPLQRRQRGFGAGGRMKIEDDRARIVGGVLNGRTTGAPIALTITNRDWRNWAEKDIAPMTIPRPGHADLSGAIKYGYRDLRLSLERASARETAARVAAGACAGVLLSKLGIEVTGYVTAIGTVTADVSSIADSARGPAAEQSDVRCPDPDASALMVAEIQGAIRARDTLGGVFEIVALNVPPGLGSHVQWDRKLEGRIGQAMLSIPAVKGVEVGDAFANTRRLGTEANDEILLRGEELVRSSNQAGGLEGGITNGEAIVVRCAMKPIASTLTPLRSVDLATGEPAETRYERSDICPVPRAVVVGEAMLALVLADALLEKLGGDSLDEIRPRYETLRRGRLGELPMDGETWRLGTSE